MFRPYKIRAQHFRAIDTTKGEVAHRKMSLPVLAEKFQYDSALDKVVQVVEVQLADGTAQTLRATMGFRGTTNCSDECISELEAAGLLERV